MIVACPGARDFPVFEHGEEEGVCESQVDNRGTGLNNQGEPSGLPWRVKESEACLCCFRKVGS